MALALLFAILCLAGCDGQATDGDGEDPAVSASYPTAGFDLSDIPAYAGSPSIEVNGNQPSFTDEDLARESFETYSALDSLGRCGPAYALIGPETMPDTERGSIGMVKPSGWQIAEYDWIDGSYLFNRCHLIAFALAGENDNPLNLITGTRTMNVQGMLPYEEQVASYVDQTGNHVLYRVTPVYDGDNLVASGVLMEAESVEDHGQGVTFCVWCYNMEPGVVIDYATGDNRAGDPEKERFDGSATEASAGADSPDAAANAEEPGDSTEGVTAGSEETAVRSYVLNTNTHRFHYPSCSSVSNMKEKNKQEFEGTREEVIEMGYQPCGVCKP